MHALLAQARLMADYNQWINTRLYAAAAELPHDMLTQDRGAFFRSVLGTLNHVMVGDRVWLSRFARHPARHAALESFRRMSAPQRVDVMLHDTLPELTLARHQLDQTIIDWCTELTADALAHPLAYQSLKGVPAVRPMGSLMMHFFNHQTHHRGQVTTLLSQCGVDIGETDLLGLIPQCDEEPV